MQPLTPGVARAEFPQQQESSGYHSAAAKQMKISSGDTELLELGLEFRV